MHCASAACRCDASSPKGAQASCKSGALKPQRPSCSTASACAARERAPRPSADFRGGGIHVCRSARLTLKPRPMIRPFNFPFSIICLECRSDGPDSRAASDGQVRGASENLHSVKLKSGRQPGRSIIRVASSSIHSQELVKLGRFANSTTLERVTVEKLSPVERK